VSTDPPVVVRTEESPVLVALLSLLVLVIWSATPWSSRPSLDPR
jgi:hypothetical protein